MKIKIGALVDNHGDLKSELELLKSCGYDYAEFGLSAPENFIEEYTKNYEEYSRILPVSVAHMKTYHSTKDEVESLKNFIMDHLKINCRNFVFHFYTRESPVGDGRVSEKIIGVKELADFAREQKVYLNMENTFHVKVEDLKKVFDEVEGIYFCLDTGHANLTGGQKLILDFIDNFRDKLKHIHAHDNLGGEAVNENDMHMPVGLGKIDFPAIFEKLKEVNFSGTITSEVHNPEKKGRQTSIDNIKKFSR